MAKNSIRDYDATAANNTDVQSTDISEGCAASGINNAIREVMADLKDVSAGTVALETPAADRLDVDNIRIDGNTISSTDTNGDITLDPDGTGDTIIASGNLGIGTSSPLTKAHIQNSDVAFAPDANADMLIVENNGTSAIQIVASDTDKAELFFSDTTRNRGGFSYNHNGDYLATVAAGSERMRIDSSGNVLVNGTTVRAKHTVSRSDASSYNYASISVSNQPDHFVFYNDSTVTGSISRSGGTGVNYNTSSDYRLKENAVDMTGAITRVKSLQPKRFNFIADDSVTVDGFMAHEAQTVVPEAVTGTHNEVDDDGNPVYQGIDQAKLVPLLTGALQEAIAKIETLETQRADLEARLTALENA